MPDDPERYVSLEELEEELPFSEAAFSVADWSGLLERLLDEESERVEGDDYVGRTWDDAADVPGPVKHGIIRLVRSRLEQIKSDGLDSESGPTGQSVTYRPPEAVRRDVQSMVAKYREDDGERPGAWVVE